MLQSISWQQYFLTTITLLVLYYLIIVVRYYKWELLNVLGIKKIETSSLNTVTEVNLKSDSYNYSGEYFGSFPTTETDASPMVRSLYNEIRAFLNGDQNSSLSKEELSDSLKIIFSKYSLFNKDDFSDPQKMIILNEINQRNPGLFEIEDFNKLCSG